MASPARRIYSTVEVEVDASEIIGQVDEVVLEQELLRRDSHRQDVGTDTVLLNEIYEVFRRRGDAPQCLSEYVYRKLGRIL
jgi:hypothetical protein